MSGRQLAGGLLALAGALVVGCAQAESHADPTYDFSKVQKVAVVRIGGDVRGNVVREQIADFFSFELLKKGYGVVERQDIGAVIEEQEFQSGDLTSAEGAARIGRILNVPAVLIANVAVRGEQINITAKLVDTESAALAWIGRGSGSTQGTLATVGGAAVGAATGAALGGDDTGQVVGGVAGGVLGGAAGHALSAKLGRQVQKVVKKIMRDMPSP